MPAAHPARKWHTGFFDDPYARAMGLLANRNAKRPCPASKCVTSARPHPSSEKASVMRFAASIAKDPLGSREIARTGATPSFELRSPARYNTPFAEPPIV